MRPRRTAPTDLYPELLRVLVLGWGAPRAVEDSGDPFRIFEEDLEAAWRKHHAAVLHEARRLRVARPWAAAEFGDLH